MSNQQHTNRLIHESSPYLLQHAHNPVDWYPWGPEAMERAKRENKPVLLSIGYSACHWCHVMEHESFENLEIARLMNENFVNIKVDREERPDLDQIYMNAVQMMTHHGGWPMTVFLTPEGVPFYGGTYFPPEDRYNMPGFPRVLLSIAEAYREKYDEVTQTAVSILGELQRLSVATESPEILSKDLLQSAYLGLIKNYDPANGGFGGAPKFPPAMTLEFVLRTFHRTGAEESLEIAKNTCQKMAEGGIYDQLGGGFHRYSTDAHWLVPHFEKMLYDNALLSRLYLRYYQLTKDESARHIVEGILDYVAREMTAPEGGFYSTQDADSEGEEGKFFVWTITEINEILGHDDASLFCAYYNVSKGGNFEGENILHITRSLEEVAAAERVTTEELDAALIRARQELFAAREKRVKPNRDEKILTAWNGLMLASFAEAAVVLHRPDYRQIAERNARFVLDRMLHQGLLLRTYKNGLAKLNAYLEDYAFFIDGLLTLFETTGTLVWFQQAVRLADKMIEEFWDPNDGGFFYTGRSHEQLIVRSKDFFDNATPSGNSVAAEVLLRLSLLTENREYERYAVNSLRLVQESMRRYPSGFGRALCALDFYLSTAKEIAVVGDPDDAKTQALIDVIWQTYLPNKVLALSAPSDSDAAALISLVRDRTAPDNRPTAYVCQNHVCQEPTTESARLGELLSDDLSARKAAQP